MAGGLKQFGIDRRLRRRGGARATGGGAGGAARDHDFLSLTARAVDDGDRLGAERQRRLGRRAARSSGQRTGRDGRIGLGAVMARVVGAIALDSRLRRAGGRRIGRDHRHRLAAERIVHERCPAHHHQAEQAQHAGQELRRGDRQLRRLLGLVLAERRVQLIRCQGPAPRESSEESTTRVFPSPRLQSNSGLPEFDPLIWWPKSETSDLG